MAPHACADSQAGYGVDDNTDPAEWNPRCVACNFSSEGESSGAFQQQGVLPQCAHQPIGDATAGQKRANAVQKPVPMLYSSHWAGQLTGAFTFNFRIQTLDSQNQISHVRLHRQGRVGAAGAAAARLSLHHEAHLRALAAAPAGQGVQVVRRKGAAAFVARVVRLPFNLSAFRCCSHGPFRRRPSDADSSRRPGGGEAAALTAATLRRQQVCAVPAVAAPSNVIACGRTLRRIWQGSSRVVRGLKLPQCTFLH